MGFFKIIEDRERYPSAQSVPVQF